MNLFEEFKEYKIVNGRLVEDIDVKTTKNDKQQVTSGYVNNTPFYIKKRVPPMLNRSRGVGKRKNKTRNIQKTLNTRNTRNTRNILNTLNPRNPYRRQPLRKKKYTYKKRYN